LDGKPVSSIAKDAFSGNANLTRVILPTGITNIEADTFSGCGKLKEIGFRGTPPASIGANALKTGNANTVIDYNADFAKQWAPKGETLWNGYSITPCLWGNVTGSGTVNAGDAAKILRYIVKLDTLTDMQLFKAEVNLDGIVSAADAAKILRYIVKLESSLL
jgi:hypothetical protein